ncbi:MAG: phosphoribosyltransferase [Frankiales bacterium]|nr:phosphoribosyltransferase [Frankiales bacterium]
MTRAPERFGSYDPEEVTWLLTDLSDVALEVPTEDREELIQGGRHYAEMLPVEFQPDQAYTALFHRALAASAGRLAEAVGLVGELLLDEHDGPPVLVSLARAGTPIGILLRRWYAYAHGLDVPHYAISIVRGRGIDDVAVQHVLARHPASSVRFVDGWTGKGAIARELAVAAQAYPGLDPRLAVLADPGSCTDLYGTRDDFLIPSACLNSTVSGLVSRTVLRDDLIGPGMFHGAKHYDELAPVDVSGVFLDAVSDAFAPVDVGPLQASDRMPTWSGWASVVEVAARYGIDDVNLVKPGVGETTRVLLRRVPWQVLVRPDREAELEHVRVLAAARGVPVVEVEDLAYSCIGLIRPAGR